MAGFSSMGLTEAGPECRRWQQCLQILRRDLYEVRMKNALDFKYWFTDLEQEQERFLDSIVELLPLHTEFAWQR